MIEIPGVGNYDINHIVFDFNGTVALDGILLEELKLLFNALEKEYTLHILTADTYGTVAVQLKELNMEPLILKSGNHTAEKAAFVENLGAEQCIAIGNGSNDALMLESAAIGIAVMGEEGCSVKAAVSADIIAPSIIAACKICLYPKRITATLRS